MLAATRTGNPEPPEREQVEQRIQREQASFWKSARTPATASVQRPEEPWELLCWITGVDTRVKTRSSHTVEPRAVYQQHLENQGSNVAKIRGHWKFRAQRLTTRVRKAFKAQKPGARLRPAIGALEKYLELEESESRPVKSLALWRAGRAKANEEEPFWSYSKYELEDSELASTTVERQADFHAFVQEELETRELHQENEQMHRDGQVRKRIAAKQAAASVQVAVHPPDFLERSAVQKADAIGLLADACTYFLPDSDSDAEGETSVTRLDCIMQDGDISPSWCESLAAVSSMGTRPRSFDRHSRTPTLLLLWAWIMGVRVKVLVDSGASTNIIAESTLQKLTGIKPVRHEQAMRVRVADGTTYDANSCIRPKLFAETSKGAYGQQVELRVMPLDLKVYAILGGPWLTNLSPVTLDYKNWGSVRFTKGREEVVITGCSPGSPDPGRPKDTAITLVQGVILSQRRARRDLRALRAKEEQDFVVYLAPDGSFGASACNKGAPNDVVVGLASEPSSGSEDSEVSVRPSATDKAGESEEPGGLVSDSSDSGYSDVDRACHLQKVGAVVKDIRPEGFTSTADEAGDHHDPLHVFSNKREANGAFALLPPAVRRQAIEDHAAGKPPTWHAQAAAALQQGRGLVAERRPRARRKRVRWRDQIAAVSQTSAGGGLSTKQPPEPEISTVPSPQEQKSKTPAPMVPPVTTPLPAPQTTDQALPEPPEDEIDETVSPEVWQQLRNLEKEFDDVICTELPDSVQSREYTASIRLRPDWHGNPLHRRGYKLSQEELRQLRQQLDELLAKGHIRPSASPWGCPVLMVPKPSNPKELRLVIYYRQINEIPIKEKYPLPDVQSLLDDLQGATVFSTMDALWEFWQIPMGADDVEKTAITTHFGAYEWLVMPMGLSNSPSTWQRMMTQYLGHLPLCRVFVDAIMIFSAEVPGKSAQPLTRYISITSARS
eukprot:gene20129-biopygen20756